MSYKARSIQKSGLDYVFREGRLQNHNQSWSAVQWLTHHTM